MFSEKQDTKRAYDICLRNDEGNYLTFSSENLFYRKWFIMHCLKEIGLWFTPITFINSSSLAKDVNEISFIFFISSFILDTSLLESWVFVFLSMIPKNYKSWQFIYFFWRRSVIYLPYFDDRICLGIFSEVFALDWTFFCGGLETLLTLLAK